MLHRHSRICVPGTVHFVTTVTHVRGYWFYDPKLCRQLLALFEKHRALCQIDCLGYVLMPDHVHALLFQNEHSQPVFDLLAMFKKISSRYFRPDDVTFRPLWNRRFDDVLLPGSHAAAKRIFYMHHNPVKLGLVSEPENYPWSSARELAGLERGIITLRPFA